MDDKRLKMANFVLDNLIFFLTTDGIFGSITRGEPYKEKMLEYVKALMLLRQIVNGEEYVVPKVEEETLLLTDGKKMGPA